MGKLLRFLNPILAVIFSTVGGMLIYREAVDFDGG